MQADKGRERARYILVAARAGRDKRARRLLNDFWSRDTISIYYIITPVLSALTASRASAILKRCIFALLFAPTHALSRARVDVKLPIFFPSSRVESIIGGKQRENANTVHEGSRVRESESLSDRRYHRLLVYMHQIHGRRFFRPGNPKYL